MTLSLITNEKPTKAEVLQRLQRALRSAVVLPLRVFDVLAWKTTPDLVVESVQSSFADDDLLIVRSSARCEDSHLESAAGKFLSVGNVLASDRDSLTAAITAVIASYDSQRPDDQFFIQKQLTTSVISGVLFTRDLETLAPYITINYDDQTTRTDLVTSGKGEDLKTYIRFRETTAPAPTPELEKLLDMMREVESLTGSDALDIEFAVGVDGQTYLFQVRPIVSKGLTAGVNDDGLGRSLEKLRAKIEKLSSPHPHLFGRSGMYSVMTDWNPAEMIGIRPKRLALSLYQELITDSIWSYQRHRYGYKDLRSVPLLINFLGRPYVDVRASFSSFIPAPLDDRLAHKLVDYYINLLAQYPARHDKVEFEIVFSCYDFQSSSRIKMLSEAGFTELEQDRLKFALLELTNRIISSNNGLYKSDFEKIDELHRRFELVTQSSLSTLDKVYWLIEDCKRYGTLPFAGLARAGFIAVQMLCSMVGLELLSAERQQQFLNSLNTVARRLTEDAQAVRAGKLSTAVFLQEYGHLRPGTYDLLSKRYDEAFELYFQLEPSDHASLCVKFELSLSERKGIADALRENGLTIGVDELFQFLARAIEGREYGKFAFTKSVSEILTLIQKLGARFGVSDEKLAHLDIKMVKELYSNLAFADLASMLTSNIESNKAEYELTALIKLPQLIQNEQNAYHFFLSDVEPNFITQQRVAELVIVECDLLVVDIRNRIVFIEGADPGYDWLFSHGIKGLITKYGGANSHMAIRCAELQIPAVIGCGERNYKEWSRSTRLEIDCANKQVKILQ